MFISLNWISDFVDLSGLDKDALIHQFSLSTAEVENEIFYKGIIEIFQKEEESTYKEAIDLYVKGIEEQELDTFLDAYGSFLVEEFEDGDGEVFIEEIYEEYESEVGEGVSIAYEVTKEKEYSESKLQKLQEELEEDYDFKGTIDKAYDITTEFTIEGDDGETDDRVKFLVVEIEGQWYLAEFDN